MLLSLMPWKEYWYNKAREKFLELLHNEEKDWYPLPPNFIDPVSGELVGPRHPKREREESPTYTRVPDFYRQVKRRNTDITLPALPSNAFQAPQISPPQAMADIKMGEGRNPALYGKRKAENLSLSAGVDEQWIGPKGEKCIKKRKHEQEYQNKLLSDALAFGAGTTAIGVTPYNLTERIQKYRWDTSCTFTCGYSGNNMQGRCAYGVLAPVWPHMFHWARERLINPTINERSRIGACGVWGAEMRAAMRNNTLAPCELTVWKLDPKHDIVCYTGADSKDSPAPEWFPNNGDPQKQPGEVNPMDHFGKGIFSYGVEDIDEKTADLEPRCPTFDQYVGTVPTYTVIDNDMPYFMKQSYNQTTVANVNLNADAKHIPIANDYFVTPQEFRGLTENFNMKPVYKRWMNPGDTAILRARAPFNFQVGQEIDDSTNTPVAVEASGYNPDEFFFAWRKKWGSLYLFRLRGNVVYNNAVEGDPADYTPVQQISYGSALLDCQLHYEAYLNHVPYSEERFNYNQSLTTTVQQQDNMAFDAETHVAPVQPVIVTNPPI